jgi:hypothetical protein
MEELKKDKRMDKKTTSEVVKKLNVKPLTAQNWARKNEIEAIRALNGGIVTYLWSEDDITRFLARPRPGGYRRKEKN